MSDKEDLAAWSLEIRGVVRNQFTRKRAYRPMTDAYAKNNAAKELLTSLGVPFTTAKNGLIRPTCETIKALAENGHWDRFPPDTYNKLHFTIAICRKFGVEVPKSLTRLTEKLGDKRVALDAEAHRKAEEAVELVKAGALVSDAVQQVGASDYRTRALMRELGVQTAHAKRKAERAALTPDERREKVRERKRESWRRNYQRKKKPKV